MSTSPHYELVADWEHPTPDCNRLDVAGVAVDQADRVYLLTRHEARVLVYDSDGAFVKTWGHGLFSNRAHGITIAPDGTVFCVDDTDQTVRKFTVDGTLLMTVGTRQVGSDSGYDGKDLASITHGGPPFNRPTNVAVAPDGEFYVSDGYGNARVHRFSKHGELLQSWGEPGSGQGQFHLPHGIAILPDARILVADRENNRIQVFDRSGLFIAEWTDIQRPTQISVDQRREWIVVSELAWLPGHRSFVHRTSIQDASRVSVLDFDGHVLARWGGGKGEAPRPTFIAPHGVATDSVGDIYVAEVPWTFAGSLGMAPRNSQTLRKLALRS